MPAAHERPERPVSLYVYATPKSPLEYIPGVSPLGSDVPYEWAQALLAVGLVSLEPPMPDDSAEPIPMPDDPTEPIKEG